MRAFLSVYDKTGVVDLAKGLADAGWDLVSSGGTAAAIREAGIEVADTATVDAEQRRLSEAGLASYDERGTTCCYARQDKFWVEGTPHGEQWEVYAVLEDAEQMAPSGDQTCCA